MATRKWKAKRDDLYRGDHKDAVGLPDPKSNKSIVRHILYLDGPGRETPYLSSSEDYAVAKRFAGRDGRVWKTNDASCIEQQVVHIGNADLLGMLKGRGHGDAKWDSALEVKMARRYAEETREHLLQFSKHAKKSEEQLRELVDVLFEGA